MTSPWIVATASATGGGTAVMCRAVAERLRTAARGGDSWITGRPATGVMAAAMSGVLAVRIDRWPALMLGVYLVAVGIALARIDILERRLPHTLLWPSYGIAATLLTIDAVTRSDPTDIARPLACMALSGGYYLALAVASRGGLGAGDVKLGGLLGLALGWHGWTAALAAVVFGWSLAAVALVGLRLAHRRPRRSTLPLGPFLLLGAFMAVLTT